MVVISLILKEGVEIDDQSDVLNILFEAEFSDFTNGFSATQPKQKIVDPLSHPLEESTEFVKIPDKYSPMRRVQKKSVIVWFSGHGVGRLSNDRNYQIRVTSLNEKK